MRQGILPLLLSLSKEKLKFILQYFFISLFFQELKLRRFFHISLLYYPNTLSNHEKIKSDRSVNFYFYLIVRGVSKDFHIPLSLRVSLQSQCVVLWKNRTYLLIKLKYFHLYFVNIYCTYSQ